MTLLKKKTLGEVMEKKKIDRQREKNAWYCQECGKKYYTEKEEGKSKEESERYCSKCGKKHLKKNDLKFSVCEKCFCKLKGVKNE